MAAEVGHAAPEFSLRDQGGSRLASSELAGGNALIVFIPFPFTSTCLGELCTIRDEMSRLKELDTGVVVITCDTTFSNRRWAEDEGFEFPILSDYWPHGEVSRAYGTFNEKTGAADRSTYVLDSGGVIRQVITSPDISTAREFDAYIEALEKLGAPSP